MSRRNPKFYFSFQSPYSWMATEVLRRRRPDVFDIVDMIPVFRVDETAEAALDDRGVEPLYVEMSKAKHLYILQDTKRLSAQLGLTMRWPIDRDPWWVLPHHAWLAARRTGDQHRLYWALIEARWGHGADICDPDTLRRIGDDVGLDGAALVAAPEDPQLRAEGIDAMEAAYFDDVFGMPYFKIGPHRFWGLDRVPDFLEALETWQEKERNR
ncbi:2-hydroxychromene-2-carboxylate isomerase [Nocardia brasiliensis]|uniref:2-hydroxychromene-2-carboxylate isomerase n=1 Tax=Nocardia brasiliensis TaxID=37326 RepID=UPI00245424F9|nr:DsbA family protein [Nocardia brasiliensis]